MAGPRLVGCLSRVLGRAAAASVPHGSAAAVTTGSGVKNSFLELMWWANRWYATESGGTSTRKSKALPKVSIPADPVVHVTLPLYRSADAAAALVEENNVVFIMSGVGNGKTSLAEFMATRPQFHLVPIPNEADDGLRKSAVKKTIMALAETVSTTGCRFTSSDVLEDALLVLGEKGHTLIFDEAHLLFPIRDLCGALFKTGFCNVLLFSASSQAADGGIEHVTPAEIYARYIWTPPAPTNDEITNILSDLNAIDGLNVDRAVFDVIYMLSGGNRSVFVYALRWVRDQGFQSADECLAGIRNGLVGGWEKGSLLHAIEQSRAVRANGRFANPADLPEEFVNIVAGGEMMITETRVRRELTIGGLVVPLSDQPDPSAEFLPYNWGRYTTKYGASGTLRASYFRYILNLPQFSMKVKYDCSVGSFVCAELLTRALPYLTFDRVVPFAVTGPDGKLSLKSAISSMTNLAPEDAYNEAIRNTLSSQGFSVRSFDSDADGGKIDHYVNDVDAALELAHFHNSRSEHADRFKSATKWTYRMAKHRAFVVLCKSEKQVATFFQDDQPAGVDFIALLVSASHESYTMTVKPAGAAEPWPPLVLQCDQVAKKIVKQDDESLILESAQHLYHISGMNYQTAAGEPMAVARPAPSESVVISVRLKDKTVEIQFSQQDDPESIERAIRRCFRLHKDTEFELINSAGRHVVVTANIPDGNYTVELIDSTQ